MKLFNNTRCKLEELEFRNFQKYITYQKLELNFIFLSVLKIPLDLTLALVRNLPGPLGLKLRYIYYKIFLGGLGSRSIIDQSVIINGQKNIFIGKLTWIDSFVVINAQLGKLEIGSRCHIGQFVTIATRADMTIGNRVGIGSGVKIYSGSQKISKDKFMCGPMIPEKYKAIDSRPVNIEDDVMIGANSVILPGVTIKKFAVIGAGSVISSNVGEGEVVINRGDKIFKRKRISGEILNLFEV